jgi:hypothetical protein
MNSFSIKATDALEVTKVQYPEVLFENLDFAPTDVSFDTDCWISPSTLILVLLPLGFLCWWSIISSIISLLGLLA